MQDFPLLLEIVITLLTASIGGVGWLFKMLFNQNVEMTNRLLELQQKTTQLQVEIQNSLEVLHEAQKLQNEDIEQIKVACDESNFYQKQVADSIKNQSVLAQLKKLTTIKKRSKAQSLGFSSQTEKNED